MALKAAVKVMAMETDITTPNNTKLDLTLRVCVLGNDIGDLGSPTQEFHILEVTPGALGSYYNMIKSEVVDWLEFHEIEVGIFDTVWVEGVGIL